MTEKFYVKWEYGIVLSKQPKRWHKKDMIYFLVKPLINVIKKQNEKLAAETRRDPTIVPRVVPVAEAMTAMVLVDFLMMWNGYRSLRRDMEGPQLGQEILSAPDA